MKTQCVIYARVSTNLQDTESQIQDLKKWANYNEYEVSGKNGQIDHLAPV